MSSHKQPRRKRAPARLLCANFDGTILVGCARAGLDCLEAVHKAIISGGSQIGCGVHLDLCRQPHEPESPRWDYVFTFRTGNKAIGVEVHHAAADQVDMMIAKKEWAMKLLADQCDQLAVLAWIWVAAPPDAEILFSRQHPATFRLAEAGISFPVGRCPLP